MSVKDQVLLLLEENKGKPMSGEEMASRLSVTRASVWKAVKSLSTQGYQIEAVNNKGYTLRTSADGISEAFIENEIKKAGVGIKVNALETIDSTNNEVIRRASQGFTEDLVVVAGEQTAGKGRRGRSFFSPAGTGIYISFLLHPQARATDAVKLTTLAAVAEAEAIEKITGTNTAIKWVNDIWIDGKKISGILTEGSASLEDGKFDYVVVGIGINVYEPEGGFPDEIKDVAGAICHDRESHENLRNRITAQLIVEFMKFYKQFPIPSYIEEYRKRCFVIGQEVTIISPDHNKLSDEVVTVLGVDEECHLHVRHADGTESYLSSGEISIKTR